MMKIQKVSKTHFKMMKIQKSSNTHFKMMKMQKSSKAHFKMMKIQKKLKNPLQNDGNDGTWMKMVIRCLKQSNKVRRWASAARDHLPCDVVTGAFVAEEVDGL